MNIKLRRQTLIRKTPAAARDAVNEEQKRQRRNNFNNTYPAGWFHNRENEEVYVTLTAYNAEAWERCNENGDYDRHGDDISLFRIVAIFVTKQETENRIR